MGMTGAKRTHLLHSCGVRMIKMSSYLGKKLELEKLEKLGLHDLLQKLLKVKMDAGKKLFLIHQLIRFFTHM